jgi:lipoprotein
MKHRIGGTATTVAVAAVLLLSSCSGQQPGPGGYDSGSWGTAPQQPPRTTTPQPSAASSLSKPQPSETFTPEQLEAANVLIEYYRIRDTVLSDLNADPQSLMDITIGQSQEIQAHRLSEFRGKGQAQTGVTVVHITGASEPVEVDGVRSVDVQMCTDVGKVDVIDSAGKSVVPMDRPQYLQWNVNVVKTETGWKFGDATNENALRCPA